MKLPSRRIGLVAAALFLALLVGFAWSLAGHDGAVSARAQEAKPNQVPPALAQQPAPHQPSPAPKKVKRVGSVVGLNEKTMQQYILLHDHVWPEVLKRIHDSNIRNYSIFVGQLDGGQYYLFSYFEYVGDDFDRDMASLGADPVTRDWWKLTDPLQRRVEGTPVGDQWKTLKQVFHTD